MERKDDPDELRNLVNRVQPSGNTAQTRDASSGGAASALDDMRDFLLESLQPLRQEMDSLLTAVLKMMKRSRRITLFGAIVAALAGVITAVATATDLGEDWQKVLGAALTAIGSLVVIFADYFQTAPNGRRIASSEEFGKLSQMDTELLLIERRAGRHDLFPLSEQEIKQMIEQTDGYAAQINQLVD